MVIGWEMGNSRRSKMASPDRNAWLSPSKIKDIISESRYHFLHQVQEQMRLLDALPQV